MERLYDFRKHLLHVHRPDRRDRAIQAADDELVLSEGAEIRYPADGGPILRRAALDLCDYLAVTQELSPRVIADPAIARTIKDPPAGSVIIATRQHLSRRPLDKGAAQRGFRIDCGDAVVICGYDDAGAMQGCFWLEDRMNIRRAPYLTREVFSSRPLFSPRMTHSGFGLDQYPDAHLAAIAHAGMDSILVFVKGVDQTPFGYLDFNDLCRRAAEYGLDVYVYSYLNGFKHPDDADADAFFDRQFGSVFAACPAFRGIILVGESCEFPSRDERTSGLSYRTPSPDGLPRSKPNPGWFPCVDYPDWLMRVRDSVRRQKADADVVFWTYNWGWAPEKDRLALIDALPTDISLQVTFEMFETVRTGNVTSTCVDYTLMFTGPGKYFLSEARRAKKRGIRLYAMVNTGGLTWDFGVVPYEPVPGQWMERHARILECRRKYGLRGLMESHHFGFWPSFISDLAKWTYMEGTPDPDETLRLLAGREFSEAHAATVLEAWSDWTEGIRHYLSTNEDQYGPYRIGPAYPLCLNSAAVVPEAPFAHFGNKIFSVMYQNHDSGRCSPMSFRLATEIEYAEKLRDCFNRGANRLQPLLADLRGAGRAEAERMIGLARFIANCGQTTAHVKRWFLAKQRLLAATENADAEAALDELEGIARAEIENARRTIPLVQADSRLGWEPSMEYMCDESHLLWKIRQVEQVIGGELVGYRRALTFNF